MLLGTLALVAFLALEVTADHEWWQTMSLYQVYPRSYRDSDGDGIGDLDGLADNLVHLKDANIDAFWLSPFYPSPMVDFGYDISNFVDVDPIFGNLADFDKLVSKAHNLDIKVVVDFVPNHSSDKHDWFQKSVKNIKPYNNYYIWKNGTRHPNGTVTPPNNWISVFGGSAWEWNDERQAFYFHQFAPQQPDLNYYSEELIEEMKNALRFWLNRGVDGFRVDAMPHLCEDSRFLDEPLSGLTDDPSNFDYLQHIYVKDQARSYEIVKGWRTVLEEYKQEDGKSRVMMIEAYTDTEHTMKFYEAGADFPFNFWLITMVNENSSAADFKNVVDSWMSNMPKGSTPNWVAGNHDNRRIATRYGPRRAQAITAMTLLLPGIGVTYYGDEIGMVDTWISWEDTQDPQGCGAGKKNYESYTRDPERSPFQWNNSTSAGFSSNVSTWLPVNDNYLTVNLENEKAADDSYFKLYKDISALRRLPAIREGNLSTRLLNSNVFAFSRETAGERSVYVVLNFSSEPQIVDLTAFDKISSKLEVYRASLSSSVVPGDNVNVSGAKIPANGVVIYVASETT
ncbi:alpha-glucosidase-like [Venturia canescens]|uniref:alpha-glucosidase-like n=1 Tax=Venturia canescens TaxID=32260 RepID=UPI001C9CE75C|nr:alpha-glucosidase-like [Venturia canescens]XP_043271078.1 alpha-glucosidase-like [Venturia canescens]